MKNITVEQAIDILYSKTGKVIINYIIRAGDGFVFSVENEDQPLFVSNNGVRGLNGNIEMDKEILIEAYNKWRNGDFY